MSEVNGRRPDPERPPEQRPAVRFAWQRQAQPPAPRPVPPAPRKPQGSQPHTSKAQVSQGPPPAPVRSPVQTVAPPVAPATAPEPPKRSPHDGGGSHRGGARRARRRRRSSASEVPRSRATTEATVAAPPRPPATQQRKERDADFAIPPPGGRLSNGRGAHLGLRVVFALTACLVLVGLTFAFGLLVGKVGNDDHTGVSAQQLDQYHVDQYPLQAGSALAQRYTDLCLNAEPSGADTRSAQLQALVSGNVASDCGWDGRGILTADDIAWTGQADPMAQYGDHGRYLHMQAAIGPKGSVVQFVVPVYVSGLHNGTGVRVAGVPGIMPPSAAPSAADAVVQTDSGTGDTGLAQMLGTDVLPGFFAAWATSSSPDIDRYRTTDATKNVRAGMSNAVYEPQIENVSVPVPGSGLSSSHSWKVGDSATVNATVTWRVPQAAHVTVGYRLTMIRTAATATGWSIRDIAGGLPDAGLDSGLASNSLPTDLPSQSAPASPSSAPTGHTNSGRSSHPAPSR